MDESEFPDLEAELSRQDGSRKVMSCLFLLFLIPLGLAAWLDSARETPSSSPPSHLAPETSPRPVARSCGGATDNPAILLWRKSLGCQD